MPRALFLALAGLSVPAVAPAPAAADAAPAAVRPVDPAAPSAPRLRGSLVTRLPGDADAERVVLAERPVAPGDRIVIAGRLARVTLEPRPWEGDVWQVRYALEPAGAARGRGLTGVFELREGEDKEIWFGAGGLHGLRLRFEAPKGLGLRTM